MANRATSSPIHVTSPSHFKQLQSSNSYLVIDFFATWCGPCKTIAPIFDALASAESQPGKLAFLKVDVDAQPEIAKQYGVSAMPTFLILKSPSSVVDTIRGADPQALRGAVLKVSAAARKGPAKQSALFEGKGRTLGTAASTANGTGSSSSGTGFIGNLFGAARSVNIAPGNGALDSLVRFVGLYVTSLLAFDAYAAAEGSAFNVKASQYGSHGGTVGGRR